MAARLEPTLSDEATSPVVSSSNLRTPRTLLCPVCGTPTLHRSCMHKNGCEVLACSVCGVGRADTTNFDPAAYYTDAYFEGGQADGYADYAGSEAVLRREFRATVEHLGRFVPRGRLLEIGCAYGFFLLEARRRFDVSGIEIAEGAVRFCHGRGLADVRHGVLDEETVRNLPSMDAIVLLDVIEHLPDPNDAFRLLASKLKPKGVLMLTTGDWSSVVARITGPHWRLMTPPQHSFYFTPKSLRILGERHGLATVEIGRPWKSVPLSLILYQLRRILGRRATPHSQSHLLSSIGIPVNLFDTMRVVYRKS